jgi:hypothetical protein
LKENEVNETLENTIILKKPLGCCLKFLRKKHVTHLLTWKRKVGQRFNKKNEMKRTTLNN